MRVRSRQDRGVEERAARSRGDLCGLRVFGWPDDTWAGGGIDSGGALGSVRETTIDGQAKTNDTPQADDKGTRIGSRRTGTDDITSIDVLILHICKEIR